MNIEFLQPGGALATSLFASLLLGKKDGYPELQPGDRVEKFEIKSQLGQGGAGAVYRAVRTEMDFEQTVALKIVRSNAELRAAFRFERRILASLEHPGISRLIDGGETEDGFIWLAMEFVDGVTLSNYLTENSTDWRIRLRYLIEIADAIDYAHRKLIVHGDIKPSNIMLDGQGRIRLLDFGIASHLNNSLDQNSTRAVTPGFASPEQISGKPITTHTDLFQFSMLIRILLLDGEQDGSEIELPSPVRNALTCISNRLAKENGRLIQMSSVLSDLHSLSMLSSPKNTPLPLVVRSRLFLYKFRKAVPATMLLMVLLGYGVNEYLNLVNHKRELSDFENRKLNSANQLLVHMLSDFGFRKEGSKSPSITDVLDNAAKNGLLALRDNSAAQLALRNLIAAAYIDSNMASKAEQLLAQVVIDDPVRLTSKGFIDDVYMSKALYAKALIKQGRYDEAEELVKNVIADRVTEHLLQKPLHDMRFAVISANIAYFRANAEKAEKLLKEYYNLFDKSDYSDSDEYVDVLLTLDTAVNKMDKPVEGLHYLRKARDITARRTSPASAKTLNLTNALIWRLLTLSMKANSSQYVGELDNELANYHRLTKEVYGEVSLQHAKAVESSARVSFMQDKYDLAKTGFEQVIRIYEQEPSLDPGYFGSALHNYASSLAISGKFNEAIPVYEKALSIRLKILPDVSDQVVTNKMDLALCLCYTHKVEQSMSLYLAALKDSKLYFGATNWRVVLQILDQSECMHEVGQLNISREIVSRELSQKIIDDIPMDQRGNIKRRWEQLR